MELSKSAISKKIFRGISISGGISIAKTVLLESRCCLESIEEFRISSEDHDIEIDRFDHARKKCLVQIENLIERSSENKDLCDILYFQKMILNDNRLITTVHQRAEEEKLIIEYIILSELKMLMMQFMQSDSEIIRSRFQDVQDVYQRLLCNIMGREQFSEVKLKDVTEPYILISRQIFPSYIASLEKDLLKGVVTEQGSSTSHVAILAKIFEIPAVSGVMGISEKIEKGTVVILDGDKGIIVVDPERSEQKRYMEIKKHREEHEHHVIKHSEKIKYICKEKIPFSIETNASFLRDVKEGYMYGASGVGLVRSEIFYMKSKKMPENDEEFRFYKSIAEIKPERPSTIRLLDVGGDKLPMYLPFPPDPVPQLGFRGIRYLLNYPDLLKRQLRNIIRACDYGNVRLLIPFVTVLEDLDRTMLYIKEILREFNRTRSDLEVGIMVEIPSVAIDIESYLDRVDFISIGTNDLSQYLFAVSRESCKLNGYHCTVHPTLLKLLKHIVTAADRSNTEVSVCGEVASNPAIACLLAGIGVRKLSMNPVSIENVREKLLTPSIEHLKSVSELAISGKKYIDVLRLVSDL